MDAKSENFQKEKEIIKEQNNSMSNELEKITNLYNKGSLTEEEYKKAKQKILND